MLVDEVRSTSICLSHLLDQDFVALIESKPIYWLIMNDEATYYCFCGADLLFNRIEEHVFGSIASGLFFEVYLNQERVKYITFF